MEAATRRLAGVGHGGAAAVAATGTPSTHHPLLWTATRGPAGATVHRGAAAAVAATADAPATHHPVLWTAFDAPGVIVWYGLHLMVDLDAYRDVILLSLGSSHGSSSPLFLLHKP